jgi:hypothetical protein
MSDMSQSSNTKTSDASAGPGKERPRPPLEKAVEQVIRSGVRTWQNVTRRPREHRVINGRLTPHGK